VQAGDGDDVVDAGGAQGLVDLLVDEPALAGDERRRDRPGLSADGICDPAREAVAGLVDSAAAKRRGRSGEMGGALLSMRPVREPTAPMPRKKRIARES
jgi:hypothetical protein